MATTLPTKPIPPEDRHPHLYQPTPPPRLSNLGALERYFLYGITSRTMQTIGAEIETQFVDRVGGYPITTSASQQMLAYLVERRGWLVESRKGDLITAIADQLGNKVFYELGRHNLEVSTIPSLPSQVLGFTEACLVQLYEAGRIAGAEPYLAPILESSEDLLIIPDERDATWLQLDGRDALAPLARISAVQFTISVAPEDALRILNSLGTRAASFLVDYLQDSVWKKYIADSAAGYLPNRYGGPLEFDSLIGYCRALTQHDVVQGTKLVPFADVSSLNIPLYLRSVWWHFRLRRYGSALCLEVRPLPRRTDWGLRAQLEKVLDAINA